MSEPKDSTRQQTPEDTEALRRRFKDAGWVEADRPGTRVYFYKWADPDPETGKSIGVLADVAEIYPSGTWTGGGRLELLGEALALAGGAVSSFDLMRAAGAIPPARPALTESQREALLIVAEVTGDLIIHAEAVELGACSRPDATELLAWAEELQRPARLLETLFDLAPKESTACTAPPITVHVNTLTGAKCPDCGDVLPFGRQVRTCSCGTLTVLGNGARLTCQSVAHRTFALELVSEVRESTPDPQEDAPGSKGGPADA